MLFLPMELHINENNNILETQYCKIYLFTSNKIMYGINWGSGNGNDLFMEMITSWTDVQI